MVVVVVALVVNGYGSYDPGGGGEGSNDNSFYSQQRKKKKTNLCQFRFHARCDAPFVNCCKSQEIDTHREVMPGSEGIKEWSGWKGVIVKYIVAAGGGRRADSKL